MMKFYDSHAHCIKKQHGGFLIGLEGVPYFEGTLTNQGVFEQASTSSDILPCYYITNCRNEVPDETFIKYHPRREQYTADEVIADIRTRKCRLCIIDTLNQPYWSYLDYWKVVQSFPDIFFILPHAGGYDILEFIKILDFTKNVYMDFSMTQEYFGWCGNRPRLDSVANCIDYALASPKLSKKIFYGSDEPFFSQEAALNKYLQLKNAEDILRNNLRNALNRI